MDGIKKDYFSIIEQLVKRGAYRDEFDKIPISARVEYIKKHENVNTHLIYSIGFEEFVNSIFSFSNDEDKCKYLLSLYSATQDNIFLGFTKAINDDFYKMKLREVYGGSNFEDVVPEFVKKSSRYNEILSEINEMNSEDEIYEYISTIDDKDIKQLFFYKTEDLTKRKKVVDSIEEDISEDMLDYAKTAQKMILDYFENNSNGLFTEKEKLELQMIFKRTKVMCIDEFESLTTNRYNGSKGLYFKDKRKSKRKSNTNDINFIT